MNAFQIVVLPIVALLLIDRVRAVVRSRAGRPAAMLWAAVWLLAGVAVAVPGTTTAVAEAMGVRRGADFVFYCAILLMFVGFFMTYMRIRRLESNLTKLVRQLAVERPLPPLDAASAEGESTGDRA